jgi:hypothetical protein
MGPIKATLPLALAIAILAGSCASMREGTGVADDIYYSPSDPQPVASAPAPKANVPAEEPVQQPKSSEDYYDPKTAQDYSSRTYYDMAYNDPYYYNYGRFGFGSGMGMGMMGWQSGWNGPGWGGGMGYGMGYGWGQPYSGWSMSMSYGYGNGFYDPWYGGWGNPYYMNPYYRPIGMYDPYMGYGYGNYYGPYGPCYTCYAPVVVGGSSGVLVGHRPSMGGRPADGGGNEQLSQPRVLRDPVGLTPSSRGPEERTMERQNDRRITVPQQERPSRTWPSRNSGRERPAERDTDRSIGGGDLPSRSGGSTPSRSGGGSSPVISPRPR